LPLRCCSRGWAARVAARPHGGCNHNLVGVCVRVGSGRSRTPWALRVDKKTIVNALSHTHTHRRRKLGDGPVSTPTRAAFANGATAHPLTAPSPGT
jgi:2-methylcitrate dehydratase PrpD